FSPNSLGFSASLAEHPANASNRLKILPRLRLSSRRLPAHSSTPQSAKSICRATRILWAYFLPTEPYRTKVRCLCGARTGAPNDDTSLRVPAVGDLAAPLFLRAGERVTPSGLRSNVDPVIGRGD